MADNTTINTGSGGDVIATDDLTTLNGGAVSAVKAQRVKVGWGVDGTFTDVAGTQAAGLPVVSQGDPDTLASGTLSATDAVVSAPGGTGVLLSGASTANSYVAVACPGGDSAWNVQLTGTFGGGTVYFEESMDSTTGVDGNWISVNGRQSGIVNTVLGNGTAAAGVFRGNTSGVKYFRVRIVGATTPSVAAVIRMSVGVGAIFQNASTPAGTNVIGTVNAVVGATTVADGHLETVTAGTRIAFPSVTCRRAIIQAADWNTGVVVVGSATTVVAAAGNRATPTRRGFALRNPGDWIEVEVTNLNLFGIDTTISGDGVTYMVTA